MGLRPFSLPDPNFNLETRTDAEQIKALIKRHHKLFVAGEPADVHHLQPTAVAGRFSVNDDLIVSDGPGYCARRRAGSAVAMVSITAPLGRSSSRMEWAWAT
ncbi:MAG: hypothetical protein ACI8RZ_002501 [Myxococcota bacterium]|jgi:hypothetical protein